jgi:hypothetical protein
MGRVERPDAGLRADGLRVEVFPAVILRTTYPTGLRLAPTIPRHSQ